MIEFEIHHTAHTMNWDEPDFEIFESTLHTVIQARKLDQMQRYCQSDSDTQSVKLSTSGWGPILCTGFQIFFWSRDWFKAWYH